MTRKYFMIIWWKNATDLAGVEPATFWSPLGHESNWATEAGLFGYNMFFLANMVFALDPSSSVIKGCGVLVIRQ